ncbi:unnamed protein product [Macrosiphum euphorbiae]|uniref:Uncharacterized protein n=1 Tax=Macrosiphum euphorbiae TaxID=13131 RepID=A0AAV0W3K3_9HEMI|nr:unnamed protein product [Macrosiphum euphorbiae]
MVKTPNSSRSKTGRFYPFESRKLMTETILKKKKNTVKRGPNDVEPRVEPLGSVLHQSDENKTACVSKTSYIAFVFSETELHEELHDYNKNYRH